MIFASIDAAFRVELSDKRHIVCADLAKDLGGSDQGPNPHELLEMALAACTLQTMKLVAKRKGWELGSTTVSVTTLEEGAQNRIGRVIKFDLHLNSEQRTKLTEIANKCPIHKLLHADVRVETEVVE